MHKEEKDVFKINFIKEFIYNTQFNQKLNIVEFLLTQKALKLFVIASVLIIYAKEDSKKYIFIGSCLVFFYLFKNNYINKKEKYSLNNKELPIHSFISKNVKKIVKNNSPILLFLSLITFDTRLNAEFANIIEKSNTTQSNMNITTKDENIVLSNIIKNKILLYLANEEKTQKIKELTKNIDIENEIKMNKIKIGHERLKNEIEN